MEVFFLTTVAIKVWSNFVVAWITVNQEIVNGNKVSRLAVSMKNWHIKIIRGWKFIKCISLLHFLLGTFNTSSGLFVKCVWTYISSEIHVMVVCLYIHWATNCNPSQAILCANCKIQAQSDKESTWYAHTQQSLKCSHSHALHSPLCRALSIGNDFHSCTLTSDCNG